MVWPFTPNDKWQVGQKIVWVETDIYKFAERPKIRWENDIKEDIRIMKINNWRECVQDRVKWKEVVESSVVTSEKEEEEEEKWSLSDIRNMHHRNGLKSDAYLNAETVL